MGFWNFLSFAWCIRAFTQVHKFFIPIYFVPMCPLKQRGVHLLHWEVVNADNFAKIFFNLNIRFLWQILVSSDTDTFLWLFDFHFQNSFLSYIYMLNTKYWNIYIYEFIELCFVQIESYIRDFDVIVSCPCSSTSSYFMYHYTKLDSLHIDCKSSVLLFCGLSGFHFVIGPESCIIIIILFI